MIVDHRAGLVDSHSPAPVLRRVRWHVFDPEPIREDIRSREFTSERAWGTLDIATMQGISVRLHWTDQPYQ